MGIAMNSPLTILGIPGSLRKDSFNHAALRAAQKLLPDGATLEIFELNGIPPYNQDDEGQLPERVVQLKSKVRAADALLFATPEYNYSFSGVLKNAIDWGSRPYGESAWGGKPGAILGASRGTFGTARAQYHLRQVLVTLDVYTMNKPEVMIASADDRFDEQGNLTDESTRQHIRKMLEALVAWTRRLQPR
jgi:chromate reductase